MTAALLLAATVAAAAQSRSAPAKPAAAPMLARYQVAAGTALLLTLRTPLDSATALVDDQVEAELWSPVVQDGVELVPKGSIAFGRVRDVVRASEKTPAGTLTFSFRVVEHAETGSRATIATKDLVIAATLGEPARGIFKRKPKPVEASIKAGTSIVAMTTEPLTVWIPR